MVQKLSKQLTLKSESRSSRATGVPPVDWILHGKRIYNFRDISMPPLRDVIEEWSADTIATRHGSTPTATSRGACPLNCSTGHSARWSTNPWPTGGQGDICSSSSGAEIRRRSFSYRSFEDQTSRKVVKAYKRNGETKPSYFRHDAFQPNFVRVGGERHLAIEPTYHKAHRTIGPRIRISRPSPLSRTAVTLAVSAGERLRAPRQPVL